MSARTYQIAVEDEKLSDSKIIYLIRNDRLCNDVFNALTPDQRRRVLEEADGSGDDLLAILTKVFEEGNLAEHAAA